MYFNLEPFGQAQQAKEQDLQFAYSRLINVQAAGSKKRYNIQDFTLDELRKSPEEKKKSPEELKAILMGIAEHQNKMQGRG